jgi:two-component system CheB/CheR fusion protein
VDGTGIIISESVHSRDQLLIEKLKRELEQGREDMRSITEEQEASNEELQSANEELLSGNEELQSLNEELETSKEEIQTTNEELIIVNQELVDRNDQLNISRMYAESIVTTIREPLIILNKNLFVRTANKSYYKRFHTNQEDTEGRLLFEIGDNQWDIPGLRTMLEKALVEKINVVDFEVTQNFPLLGERVMCLNVSFISRDINQEQCLLLAIEDVTEKRKASTAMKLFADEMEKKVLERTQSLHEANMELQHSNKHLKQFAYVASHDLQEPLRKMRTFSSLLLDKCSDDLPEMTKELVSKIASASERMSTLIKEVLNFSKILHGATVFEKTDLNQIVKNVLEDFELLIQDKNAVITCESLPVIEAIPLQINQLFYNLISNSLKFAKKEIPPVIDITSKMLTAEEAAKHSVLKPTVEYCEISVKDNGIGFDQQYAEQVFLIFQHLHTRENYQGAGIGLALSKTIVINHHGEILATSSEGKGALLQIILPIRQS